MIESLEKRVSALEKKTGSQEAPAQNPAEVPSQSPVESSPPPAPDGNDLRVYWNEGLRLDSNNGAFKLKIGGRIQNDWGFFGEGDDIQSSIGDSMDGTEFRRARFFVGGTFYENFEFKAQYDFEDGVADWKDVWMSAKNVPYFGTLKVGHFKEPFGLEQLTSSKDISFMERSTADTFVPSRNTGIAFSNSATNKRLAYSAGLFRETGAFGESQSDSGSMNVTGRISGVPLWNEDGDHYLHLGAAASFKNIDAAYTPGTEAEAHMAQDLVGVTGLAANDTNLYGAEVAYVRGPFSAQSEYILADIDALSGSKDATFDAYYLMGSYFITGEHRRYKLGSGVFDKIRPKRNFGFGEDGGPGAWELLIRYSQIDLEDSGYTGGELTDLTLGVNWHLNPNMKVMLNYIHGELEDGLLGVGEEDDIDYIMTRFQVTW
ncbi:MAG TPA: porin [Candidatus Hydrogenedentes bacterium]|nr:porin [Candidatus Hydrogenedentota bacterium]